MVSQRLHKWASKKKKASEIQGLCLFISDPEGIARPAKRDSRTRKMGFLQNKQCSSKLLSFFVFL
jgi:hypothetical protein